MLHRTAAAGFLAFLMLASPAHPCTCASVALDAATVTEAVEKADAVFEGKVVHSQVIESPAGLDGHLVPARMATFEVSSWWKRLPKGNALPRIAVFSGDGRSGCGYVLETGKSYVVFASFSSVYVPGALNTNLCTFTRKSGEAALLIRLLGEPGKEK